MKKLSKEDLSLDKQEVSSLGGPNGMNYATDGSPNPTVQTTLDSHGPICCDFSHNETCGKTCELSKCICSVIDDTCDSYVPDCLIPLPETKDCPE